MFRTDMSQQVIKKLMWELECNLNFITKLSSSVWGFYNAY